MKLNNKPLNIFNLLEQMRLGDCFKFKYNKSTIDINLDNRKLQNNEIKIFYYFECDTIGAELDCKVYDSLDELLNNALIEGRKISDISDNIELVLYDESTKQKQLLNNNVQNTKGSKKAIMRLILGVIIGLVIGIIISCFIKGDINNIESIENSTRKYDKKFVGKWEYGTENIEEKLESTLSEYKSKYELKEGSWGCTYNGSYLVSETAKNTTLLINEDGSVEYFDYFGAINSKCEIEIKTNYHYKGTFENSKIVFKQAEANGVWNDFRSVHNIYLVDNDTLHYKVNDENPSSATYLFIKKN